MSQFLSFQPFTYLLAKGGKQIIRTNDCFSSKLGPSQLSITRHCFSYFLVSCPLPNALVKFWIFRNLKRSLWSLKYTAINRIKLFAMIKKEGCKLISFQPFTFLIRVEKNYFDKWVFLVKTGPSKFGLTQSCFSYFWGSRLPRPQSSWSNFYFFVI